MFVRTGRTALVALLVSLASSGSAIAQGSAVAPAASIGTITDTQVMMLSGHGPDDAVPWDFMIDAGRRAGERATIPVPSNWQQQGFGTYQYGLQENGRTKAHGIYRRTFFIPGNWKDKRIRLVFDGVMTDARVKVNGVDAGPVHQGGYYRFGFDVSRLLNIGQENSVEVDVAEASVNSDTEKAERLADYWDFSGIFRPVWLEAMPAQAIEHSAIDARASGDIVVDVTLAAPRTVTRVEAQVTDAAGKPVGLSFSSSIPAGGAGRVRLVGHVDAPSLWNAETPNLYGLTIALFEGDRPVHRTTERFGFRTFEVRAGDGLYLNGQRILLKGVNRHSFRPNTARTLSRKDNYDDVRTIRSMNMNAVRMSHYPPDQAFLEACDELGLYVLDELSGWQHAHDTQVGRRLVREMVERDVNHPSIVLWDNGNEGGFNRELDGDFQLYDPQARKVMHPWELHDGIDTKHYPDFADLGRRLAGPNLVMPTEFMHALFDGGGGAGYEDYWTAIAQSPRGAGGFIWAFADEGIARTDRNGEIDNYATYAPDGVVGARHEKEPSYYTVRDILSPVQIAAPRLDSRFGGRLRVTNGFDFTPLQAVQFQWKLLRFAGPQDGATSPRILREGRAAMALAPHASGDLALPLSADWRQADALSVTARKGEEELWTWVWPVEGESRPAVPASPAFSGRPIATRDGAVAQLSAGGVVANFDVASGLLTGVVRGGKRIGIADGPRLVAIGPRSDAEPTWTPLVQSGPIYRTSSPAMADMVEVNVRDPRREGWTGFDLEVSPDGENWRTVYRGKRNKRDGDRFWLQPGPIVAVRITNLRASENAPVEIESVRVGYEPSRFTLPPAGPVAITTGTERDGETGQERAWLEARGAGGLDSARWTLAGDGTLALDYRYALSGRFVYHGVSFDTMLGSVDKVRGLLEGPRPVWQNRLRGNVLGVHTIAARDDASLPGPEQAGYFGGVRWARFDGAGSRWVVSSASPTYLRLGTRLNDQSNTTADFPEGDISFLHAIPGMGSKFITASASGPGGEASIAHGGYAGRLVFSFGESRARRR